MVAVIVVVWIVDPETVSDSRRISKKADFKRKIDKINETLEYRRIVVGGSYISYIINPSIYRFIFDSCIRL